MGTSNYAGCPWENYDSTDKNCCDGGDGDGDCAPVTRTLITAFEHDSTAQIDNAGEPLQFWPLIADGWVTVEMGNVVREHGRSQAGPGSSIDVSALGGPPGLDIEFEAVLNLCVRKTTANATQIGVRCVASYPGAPPIILAPKPADEWCRALGGPLVEEFWSPSLHVTVPRFSDVLGALGPPSVHWECHRIGPNDGDIEIQGATFDVNQALPVYTQEVIDNCETGDGDGDGDGDCLFPESATVDINEGPTVPLAIGGPPVVAFVGGLPDWSAEIFMSAPFGAELYITEVLLDGLPEPEGVPPLFATITQVLPDSWYVSFTTPPDGSTISIRVTRADDPLCTWTQPIVTTQES